MGMCLVPHIKGAMFKWQYKKKLKGQTLNFRVYVCML